MVDAWTAETRALSETGTLASVQIFENRGDAMGASNPHPHCQIWANETVPDELAPEVRRQQAHSERTGRAMLLDYADLEETRRERIVTANGDWLAVVPFWAVWPFETLVLLRRPLGSFLEMSAGERAAFADLLGRLTTRYDNLFGVPFPYTMGFHQRPCGPEDNAPGFVFHAHFYPPLLRSATVRKFMVGYEMLASPQRDITAESAAGRLREQSEVHDLRPSGAKEFPGW